MMAAKWMLTLRADCDIQKLAAQLSELHVQLDTARPPLPLGVDEKAVTVSVKGETLPTDVSKLDGVLRANPSSRMSRFGRA